MRTREDIVLLVQVLSLAKIIAPKATVISMQVIRDDGNGGASDIVKALEYIAEKAIDINVRPFQERLLYQLA